MLNHISKHDHYFNLNCINFNYDVWCDDCGEVFSDEVK